MSRYHRRSFEEGHKSTVCRGGMRVHAWVTVYKEPGPDRVERSKIWGTVIILAAKRWRKSLSATQQNPPMVVVVNRPAGWFYQFHWIVRHTIHEHTPALNPFKNLHLYAAIIPGKLQVCLKVRRIFPDQISASYLLSMENAVTATGSQNKTGRSEQANLKAEWWHHQGPYTMITWSKGWFGLSAMAFRSNRVLSQLAGR